MARLGAADGPSLHCTPCRHCFQLIREVGIEKVVSVDESGEIRAERTKNMEATHVSLGNQILGKA